MLGAELKVGDVFEIVVRPKGVSGHIFWKRRSGRICVEVVEKGVRCFRDIADVRERDILYFELDYLEVNVLGTFNPYHKSEKFKGISQ